MLGKACRAIGMDYSYYDDVPLSQTQTYTELMEWCDRGSLDELFIRQTGIGGRFSIKTQPSGTVIILFHW